MSINNKIKTIFKLAAGGGLIGWAISLSLGATAVGILGAGIGWPAGLAFAAIGILSTFAIYGLYRLIKG